MRKILIIDDELLARKNLKTIVRWEDLGYTIADEAANGKTALELTEKIRPDLIFTDITMPVMNGIELVAALQNAGNPAKIVILSCHEDFNYLREAMRLGAADYLLKHTFEAADILALIEKMDAVFQREDLAKEDSRRLGDDVWRRFLLGQIETGERMRCVESGLLPNRQELFKVFCFVSDKADREKKAARQWEYLLAKAEGFPVEWIRLVPFDFKDGENEDRRAAVIAFAEGAGETEILRFSRGFTGELYKRASEQVLNFSISGSPLHSGWREIHKAYLEAASGIETGIDVSGCGQKIRQAVSFIKNNYKRPISLEDIAEHSGISRVYLSQIFKKETGQNVSDFLLNYRLGAAKRLLTESSLKIYEIAGTIGFGSVQYFSQTFKEKTGVNPNEYRDRLNHNNS